MKTLPVVFLLLFVLAARADRAVAQDESRAVGKKFTKIDKYAMKTPKRMTDSLTLLATYLVKPAKTPAGRARAIYRWVTHNIALDTKVADTLALTIEAETVLASRKTNSTVTPSWSASLETWPAWKSRK